MAEQKIVEKIKKLLELGKSQANEHEAALALQRAHELMGTHKVAIKDLQDISPIQMDKVIDRPMKVWEEQLLKAVAYKMCCDTLFQIAGSTSGWGHLVGRPEDIQAAEYLYRYLHRELDRMAETEKVGEDLGGGRMRVRGLAFLMLDDEAVDFGARTEKWKDDFKLGAVIRLSDRLKDSPPPDSEETALVLQREAKAVHDYIKSQFPRIPEYQEKAEFSYAGRMGYGAAGKINLDAPEKRLADKKPELEE